MRGYRKADQQRNPCCRPVHGLPLPTKVKSLPNSRMKSRKFAIILRCRSFSLNGSGTLKNSNTYASRSAVNPSFLIIRFLFFSIRQHGPLKQHTVDLTLQLTLGIVVSGTKRQIEFFGFICIKMRNLLRQCYDRKFLRHSQNKIQLQTFSGYVLTKPKL